MGRMFIRDNVNGAWIDAFCSGGYRIRNSTNTGWINMTTANTFIRDDTNTAWIQPTCPPPYDPVSTRVLRIFPQSNLRLNSGPNTAGFDATEWPGVGPSGASLVVYSKQAYGFSALSWIQTLIMHYSVTACPIVSGPRKGQMSNYVFNGTTWGADINYHPRMGVVYWGGTGWVGLASWSGAPAGTQAGTGMAMYRPETPSYLASFKNGVWSSTLKSITYEQVQPLDSVTTGDGGTRVIGSMTSDAAHGGPWIGAVGITYYTLYEDLFGNGPGTIAPYAPYAMAPPI